MARRLTPLLLAGVLLAASCGGSDDVFPRSVPTVDVALDEYGFDYEPELSSGRTVFRVRNAGTTQHQLVLIYLPPEIPSLDAQLRSSERQVVPTVVSLQPREPGRPRVQRARGWRRRSSGRAGTTRSSAPRART